MRAMVVMLACAAAVAVAGAGGAAAQEAARPKATPGPVFMKYGPVFDVPHVDLTPDPTAVHKVVFDVTESPDDTSAVNPGIVSLARFFNLYARAGVSPEHLQLAIVAHGAATKDVIGHAGYRKRYGADNPNLELMAALVDKGVRVYVCGQALAARGVARDELAPDVKVAPSATAALLQLQSEGYRVVR